jgi:hypothetical protein
VEGLCLVGFPLEVEVVFESPLVEVYFSTHALRSQAQTYAISTAQFGPDLQPVPVFAESGIATAIPKGPKPQISAARRKRTIRPWLRFIQR